MYIGVRSRESDKEIFRTIAKFLGSSRQPAAKNEKSVVEKNHSVQRDENAKNPFF